MSEPQLRAKVRRGLLKVEQLHALARAVYYGQRGRISAREGLRPDERVLVSNPDPRLHRLLAGQEISRLPPRRTSRSTPDLLRHVSPIEWKNVILYGEIKIDPSKLKMRGS